MQTVIALYVASIKELIRDKTTLFAALAFPLLAVGLIAFIYASDTKPVYTLGIASPVPSRVESMLMELAGKISNIKLEHGDAQTEKSKLREGKVDLVIELPADADQRIASNRPVTSKIYYDSSDQAGAQSKLAVAGQLLAAVNQLLVNEPQPIDVEYAAIQTTKQSPAMLLMPMVIVTMLMQIGLTATAPYIVSLREKGILRHLGVTPLPRWKLLASQVLARLSLALVQTIFMVTLIAVSLQVALYDNLLLLAFALVLGVSLFIAMGYLIASISKTAESANQLSSGLYIIMLFLSGVIFPISMVPSVLLPIVHAMPTTYVADAIRQLLVGGVPQYPLLMDFAVMFAWLAGGVALSIRLFKWE